MKKRLFEDYRGLLKRAGAVAMAVIIAGTGFVAWQDGGGSYSTEEIPELVSFTDPEEDLTEVEEDETPLGVTPTVTKKVTKKNSTKKVKMKKKAKKSGTTTKKKTNKKTKTQNSTGKTVKTETTVVTTTKTTTKKNSKVKTVKTNVVTTVVTTTTPVETASDSAGVSLYVESGSSGSSTAATTVSTTTYTGKEGSISDMAPKTDTRVLKAFEKMYGEVKISSGVSYSGCFDASTMTITLKKLDSTIYHELGHFVEFVGGVNTVKQEISTAYNEEKSKYTAYNKSYVLQNSSEYFAESFKNYCEDPASLKSARPKTYAAITSALNNMTDSRINTLLTVYGSLWNK